MLRYLTDQGVSLGTRIELTKRHPFGGPAIVRVGERELPLGDQLARAMQIELEELVSESAATA
jgi:DtxR family Mn-dependent transcriptional regulator